MGNPNRRFAMHLRSTIPLIAMSLLFWAAAARSLPVPGISPQQTGAVSLAQGISDLANKLAEGIPEGHPMTVAVTDFPDLGGQTCRLGRYVAEKLSTLMSQHPQCHLVERRRLDMVLQELKFSMSELVDPAKAKKLGQMLGVQGLVIGTVSDVGSTIDLDARIIDIQTDVSLPGASASIVKDEAVSRMSSDCGSATGPPIAKEPEQPPLPPTTVKPAVVEGITFEVRSCGLSGTSVTCHMVVTNGAREDQNVGINWLESRMIDGSGNEFRCQRVRFGSIEGYSRYGMGGIVRATKNTLVSGTPTNLVVTFEKVSAEATRISLLEIKCYFADTGARFVAQVRDIPLTK